MNEPISCEQLRSTLAAWHAFDRQVYAEAAAGSRKRAEHAAMQRRETTRLLKRYAKQIAEEMTEAKQAERNNP